jgi:anti-sigma regulatory factor (Ser/Thr protein kinase)
MAPESSSPVSSRTGPAGPVAWTDGAGRPDASTISVPAESEQATIVRQFVRLACHRYGCDAVTENILLVTDEMLAAALAHTASAAESTVEVGIIPTQRGVRIEVHDHVHDEPGGPQVRDEDQSLKIVSTLASEWGVADESDGTVLWAEIARSGAPTPA